MPMNELIGLRMITWYMATFLLLEFEGIHKGLTIMNSELRFSHTVKVCILMNLVWCVFTVKPLYLSDILGPTVKNLLWLAYTELGVEAPVPRQYPILMTPLSSIRAPLNNPPGSTALLLNIQVPHSRDHYRHLIFSSFLFPSSFLFNQSCAVLASQWPWTWPQFLLFDSDYVP